MTTRPQFDVARAWIRENGTEMDNTLADGIAELAFRSRSCTKLRLYTKMTDLAATLRSHETCEESA